MKTWETTAALMIVVASVIGCDDKDSKPVIPASPPPVKSESTMDKMNGMMNSAKEAGKDAAAATETKAAELKDKATGAAIESKDVTAAKTTDAMNQASAVAADAKASIVETAQKYYDQAKGYMASNNLTSANDMITKLDGIKSQLPAEWQTKVDELKVMYDKAKAGVGNLMPKMGN